tara:strand:+ start:2127 stop:2948 length:822 start_codon:yes stop_codon:yes gene_type:complete
MDPREGFEPSFAGSEPAVLPLDDRGIAIGMVVNGAPYFSQRFGLFCWGESPAVRPLRALQHLHWPLGSQKSSLSRILLQRSLMDIYLNEIFENPRNFNFCVDSDWWRARGADSDMQKAVLSPTDLRVEVSRLGSSLYLEGSFKGVLSLTCSRCLERYCPEFRDQFRLVLEPAGERVPADPEGARQLSENGLYLSEELEFGWFSGQELTLDDFFAELLMLAVPVQPVCKGDCLGLCPSCGVNRNESACDCRKESANRPFEILAGFKERLTRRED